MPHELCLYITVCVCFLVCFCNINKSIDISQNNINVVTNHLYFLFCVLIILLQLVDMRALSFN